MIILDGGMGRELERMGAPFRRPEWSALALMQAPEKVREAHVNFLKAGAEILTTNSYAVVPFHIGEERYQSQGRDLIELSARLAQEAIKETGSQAQIAACIPPFFGSYNPAGFELHKAHEMAKLFIDTQKDVADIWLAETISSSEEAIMLCSHLSKLDKPYWLAFTITKKTHLFAKPKLRSKENIEEAIDTALMSDKHPEAILFNCCQPEIADYAIRLTRRILDQRNLTHIQCGAYANSFIKMKRRRIANSDTSELRNDITPEKYLKFAQKWKRSGATIIGGCCGIGPDHIRVLSEQL